VAKVYTQLIASAMRLFWPDLRFCVLLLIKFLANWLITKVTETFSVWSTACTEEKRLDPNVKYSSIFW
jgi:hypothetical protein